MSFKKPVQAPGIHSGSTTVAAKTVPTTLLPPTFRGSSLVLYRLPYCQSRVRELPLAQVSCFYRYPHHGLDPFAHIITRPFFGLVSGSSAQRLAVDLCICFHQLLGEGSKMTIKVVIDLLTEAGQLRLTLRYFLGS